MRSGLIQGGITSSDWFSERELMALHISMVTRMDSAMLMGSGAWKISQEMPLNLVGSVTQEIQWESYEKKVALKSLIMFYFFLAPHTCQKFIWGPVGSYMNQ